MTPISLNPLSSLIKQTIPRMNSMRRKSTRICIIHLLILFIILSTQLGTSVFYLKSEALLVKSIEKKTSISSPNGNLGFELYMSSIGDDDGCIFYNINYHKEEILKGSRMGLAVPNILNNLSFGFGVNYISISSSSDIFNLPLAEKHLFDYYYNELNVGLINEHGNKMNVIIRAYNEGIAFRYFLPDGYSNKNNIIEGELTSFQFKRDYFGFSEYGTEGKYKFESINSIKPKCEIPFTIDLKSNGFLSINEGHLDDYSRMYLKSDKNIENVLKVELNSKVNLRSDFYSPWRVLIFGEKPGDLIENGQILYSLCPPSKIENTAWIKGGKSFRDTTLSTNGSKMRIDFMAENNMQFLLLDASWYGPEWNSSSDATTVIPKDLDLDEVISYGKNKGIGVFLYINKLAIVKQINVIFPLYEKWGIAGVKFGFMDGRTQKGINFIHKSVIKAAEHHLLVNIHDNYRPTGMSRTYPNLLTQEGIRGNEHDPISSNNVVLPYTRMICGAADYTPKLPSYNNDNTRIHQLSLPIILYSPLNSLFWYQSPEVLQNLPEKELWKIMPTIWDESVYPDNILGKNAICARKSGEDWFVGAIINSEGGDITIPLDFLEKNITYKMRLYQDREEGEVLIEDFFVNSEKIISETLFSNGGLCLYITKKIHDDIGYYYSFKRCDIELISMEQDSIDTINIYYPNGANISPIDISRIPHFIDFNVIDGIFTINTYNLKMGSYYAQISLLVDNKKKENFFIEIEILNVNDPPEKPIIKSPSSNMMINELELLDFIGNGSDPDLGITGVDEELTFNWISNIQGYLGKGEILIDINLSIGEHIITLKVTDLLGLTNSVSIIIAIIPLNESDLIKPIQTQLFSPRDGEVINSTSTLIKWKTEHEYPLSIEYIIFLDTTYPPVKVARIVKGSTELLLSDLNNGVIYYYSIISKFYGYEIDNCTIINAFLVQNNPIINITLEENVTVTRENEKMITLTIDYSTNINEPELNYYIENISGFQIYYRNQTYLGKDQYNNFTIIANRSLMSGTYIIRINTWIEDEKGNRYHDTNQSLTIYVENEQNRYEKQYTFILIFTIILLISFISLIVISKRRILFH